MLRIMLNARIDRPTVVRAHFYFPSPGIRAIPQASAGGCPTTLDCPVIDVIMRTISTSLTWQPLNAPWSLRYATRDTIHTITYRTTRQNTGRCHACNLKTRASSEPFRRSRPCRAIHPWDGRGAGEDAPSGAVGWREVLHHDARELA